MLIPDVTYQVKTKPEVPRTLLSDDQTEVFYLLFNSFVQNKVCLFTPFGSHISN